jgi:hypothetical protein
LCDVQSSLVLRSLRARWLSTRSRTCGLRRQATPPENASALSGADKVATIRAYYDDVSSRRYDDAYGRLEAGSYESSSALSSRYCEVSRFALTAFQDVPDNPALNATIVGYSNDGTATTYKGTINLVHDERTGQWLLQRPALDRVDGPKLVGLP